MFQAALAHTRLPPGDYVVEVDGNRVPFPAEEGAVLEIAPEQETVMNGMSSAPGRRSDPSLEGAYDQ